MVSVGTVSSFNLRRKQNMGTEAGEGGRLGGVLGGFHFLSEIAIKEGL